MEMNKNLTEGEKRINEIWKSNPKIPFMQSKKILAYAYNIGFEDASKKFQQQPKEEKNKVNEQPKKSESRIKLNQLNEILKIMNNKRDFSEVYVALKNEKSMLESMVGENKNNKKNG